MLFKVLPSDTDPAIQQFNSPHTVYLDASVKPRGELLLFLPGTNGKTASIGKFCSTAAELGYQVINLMYPDDIAAAVVRDETEPNSFLNFRLTVIEGKPLSRFVSVDRADSIENRLAKLLRYIDAKRPAEQWSRFLTSDGQPEWSHIAVSGLSQGAGHAALIAVRHRVARAVLFGGPKDYSRALNKPAAWYTPPATPLDLIFTFNHMQDRQGCNFQQQLEICRTMGLEKFGAVVNVDSTASPFHGSHILSTNYPGTTVASVRAHTSVVADGASPRGSDGIPLFKPVWVYMLTAGSS